MLTRFGFGLVKGLLVGGLLAALLVFGASLASVPVWAAYLLAILTGALSGLIAGKPIWQKDARIEAGLKSAAGAVLGALGLFAVNRWLPIGPDLLHPLHAARFQPDQISVAALPLISLTLSLLFELDNTPSSNDDQNSGTPGKGGKKTERPQGKVRVPGAAAALDEPGEEPADPSSAAAPPARRNTRR